MASMQTPPSSPPKPVSEVWRPDLVALPKLTPARRAFRQFARGLVKLVAAVTMKPTVRGLEQFPSHGPALIVFNHLGDADAVLMGSTLPVMIDGLGKIELNEHFLVGPLFRAYGIIWVHRGRPDRRALRAALEGLAQGRMIGLSPEGRQSVSGGLEEGNEGAAFLALKSGAPIVPIAMTGTENAYVYGQLKQGRRAKVTLEVGEPFYLKEQTNRQAMLREGTQQIMESLARMLPEAYRGNYKPVSSSQP